MSVFVHILSSSAGNHWLLSKKDDVGNDTYGFYVDSDLEGYIIDANGKPVDDAVIFDTVLDYNNNYAMFIKDLQLISAVERR